MIIFQFFSATTALLMLGLTLASCTPTISKRGNAIEEEQLQQITVGESSREDVAKVLGTPTQMATFDDKTWYYIGQRTEQEAFYDPELKEQKIVTVEFTPEGKVASVNQTGSELAKNIDPSSDKTPTYGKELSIVQQLLGNLGRPTVPKGKEGR
jgi:outer membrane protein assembly factor BamE (lipoprotein component of BamABCDE complex)